MKKTCTTHGSLSASIFICRKFEEIYQNFLLMKLFFLSALLFAGMAASAQDSLAIQQYLNNNREQIILDGTKDIALFDDSFYKNTFFLFGENHGSSNPQLADVLLFKQLQQKAAARFYIAEVDDTKAWLLNRFMQTGNILLLKKVFLSWQADTAQWANESNYNKFVSLQQLYKTLPANKKFTIIGIDDVQDYHLLKEYALFFKEKNTTAQLAPFLDTLAGITDSITIRGRKNLGSFARRMKIVLSALPLNSKQQDLNHFVTSLSFIGLGIYRDSLMYKNLQSSISIHGWQHKKMYGFLGYYHCLQAGYEKSMPFAALLKKHGNPHDQVVSIQMMAAQSKTLLPLMAQLKQMMPASYIEKLRKENADFPLSEKYIPFDLSNDNSMMKIDGIQYLKAATSPNSTTLFKLDNVQSPFAASKLLGEVKGFQSIKFTEPSANTLQAFQYILFFRESKAGIPVE